MIMFKDKTFCASPNCKNECGRKMTKKEEEELEAMRENCWMNVAVSQAYFCDEPIEEDF